MEALFAAARQLVSELVSDCTTTTVYEEEACKLARFVCKVYLLLSELELQVHIDEELRGSRSLFVALDSAVSALQLAGSLVKQCSKTPPGSVWPVEDAVEFQSVAAELLAAVSGLHRLDVPLPSDIREDLHHFHAQFRNLQFTTGELSETEDVELARLHKEGFEPRSPTAAAAAAAANEGEAQGTAAGEELLLTPSREPSGAAPPGPKAPLPEDPFSMERVPSGRLAAANLSALRGLRLDDADSGAVRAPVTALEAGADAEPLSGSREAQQQPSDEEAVRNLQDLAQLVD